MSRRVERLGSGAVNRLRELFAHPRPPSEKPPAGIEVAQILADELRPGVSSPARVEDSLLHFEVTFDRLQNLDLDGRRHLARARAMQRAEEQGIEWDGWYEQRDMAAIRRLPARVLKMQEKFERLPREAEGFYRLGQYPGNKKSRNASGKLELALLREEKKALQMKELVERADRLPKAEKSTRPQIQKRIMVVADTVERKGAKAARFLPKPARIRLAAVGLFVIGVIAALGHPQRESFNKGQISGNVSDPGVLPPSLFVEASRPSIGADVETVARQGSVRIAPDTPSGEIISKIPSTEELPSSTEEIEPPDPDSFASFLKAAVKLEPGDSLFKIINDLSEQYGGNWVNTENGVTRGHVLAAIVANYMKQKGFNPNLIYPGDIFSLQALGMPQARLAILERTWKTDSAKAYINDVMPDYQKLKR